MSARTDAASHLPLKPVVLHILLALSGERSHGYEIMQTVAERSEGSVQISTAVLYRTLSRLLKQQLLVESASRPDPADDDSRRRYYELTPLGREVLALELGRLRSILSSRNARLLLRTVDGN